MRVLLKLSIAICLLVGFCFTGFGQESVNLVVNPSFEDTVACPPWLGDDLNSVTNWTNPTWASPDHFHSCNNGDVGVPQNVFGYQDARTGNAYVGVHTSDFSSNDYREYVQGQLISPLEAGKYYEVSFFVSRTDSSTKACDNIGAYLSTVSISASNNQNLPYTPQVVSKENNPITNDTGWVQIIDTIVAVGGEQYLTLGVFTNNTNTNWVSVSGGWESEAHYYIDDVSVKEISSNSVSEFNQTQISVYPNPANGHIYVNSPTTMESLTIYSTIGQLVFKQSPKSNNYQVDLSQFSEGIYYVKINTHNSIITNKIIINR